MATHWHDEVKAGIDEDVPPDAYLTGNAIDRIRRMERLSHRPSKRGPPPQDGIRHSMGTLLVPIDATRVHVSGEGYRRRYGEIVSAIGDKTKCVDDTLLWSGTIERSYFQAVQWLDICGWNGIILNSDKFVFRKSTVDFSGFTITMTDVRPCSRYLEAIRDFPEPRNINNVRSWFRLVYQVTYAFSMAERMHPFRKLLTNGERITWWPELEDIFRESKDAIVQEIEHDVRIFEKTKPTCAPSSYLFSPESNRMTTTTTTSGGGQCGEQLAASCGLCTRYNRRLSLGEGEAIHSAMNNRRTKSAIAHI